MGVSGIMTGITTVAGTGITITTGTGIMIGTEIATMIGMNTETEMTGVAEICSNQLIREIADTKKVPVFA